jgi:hypothetical protein
MVAMTQLMNLEELALRIRFGEFEFGDSIQTGLPKLKKLDLHEKKRGFIPIVGTENVNEVLTRIPCPEWILNSIAAIRSSGIPKSVLELFASRISFNAQPSLKDMTCELFLYQMFTFYFKFMNSYDGF